MLRPSGPTLFYELYYKFTGGCELNAGSFRRIYNLLNTLSAGQTWKKFSAGQPQSSVLDSDLYNIFINDLVENILGLFTKFVVDFKKRKAKR